MHRVCAVYGKNKRGGRQDEQLARNPSAPSTTCFLQNKAFGQSCNIILKKRNGKRNKAKVMVFSSIFKTVLALSNILLVLEFQGKLTKSCMNLCHFKNRSVLLGKVAQDFPNDTQHVLGADTNKSKHSLYSTRTLLRGVYFRNEGDLKSLPALLSGEALC